MSASAASDPSVDRPQFPAFLARTASVAESALKIGEI
jgi:hypothetical protein